jgi:Uncharacterized conserved protein (COG2071)
MIWPKNPFTVRGRLRRCWLFVYRTPAKSARALLPPQLELVTRVGFAFWNIVVCEISGLRPALLPAAVGLDYWHVAYRLHVRAHTAAGVSIEGLHFLRSDCDRTLVALAGNFVTDFRFHRATVAVSEVPSGITGQIRARGGDGEFRLGREAPSRPAAGSPFASLEEAAEWLKYKPFGISPCGERAINVVRVARDEAAWRSRLVTVQKALWEFLEPYETALEICYEVAPIDYRWERGRIYPVMPCAS